MEDVQIAAMRVAPGRLQYLQGQAVHAARLCGGPPDAVQARMAYRQADAGAGRDRYHLRRAESTRRSAVVPMPSPT